jgi:Flp pilus assembly protein TadG
MKMSKYSERGQALILIVFAMIGLIGLTGLTVDGGLAYSDRRNAQNAADTAALAAARAMIRSENWESAALNLAAANGYDNNGATNEVQVVNPPTSGNYAGDDEYIQVFITSHLDTFFAPVVGVAQLTNNVNAVARAETGSLKNMFEGEAVVGLNPHDCKAVKYQGNANTVLTGGGIFVNSDCATSAFFNNSSAAQLTSPHLCSVGGVTYKPQAINIPAGEIKTGCEAVNYPVPDYIMPLPSCPADAVKTGNTLSPGNFSGTFPGNGVNYLESGVYCVDGNFRVNGGDLLVGNDVVIYMIDGDVTWNGGAEIHLDAPDEGVFKNLLIYIPYENEATVKLNGNSASTIEGTILAPASNITVDGTGDTGINGQIIGYTVDLSGSTTVRINYSNSNNYQSSSPPNIQLAE